MSTLFHYLKCGAFKLIYLVPMFILISLFSSICRYWYAIQGNIKIKGTLGLKGLKKTKSTTKIKKTKFLHHQENEEFPRHRGSIRHLPRKDSELKCSMEQLTYQELYPSPRFYCCCVVCWDFFSAFHLTLPVPIPDKERKLTLNVYFHTSLWCLKRFYGVLKGLHKTFWGTTKKRQNKYLS